MRICFKSFQTGLFDRGGGGVLVFPELSGGAVPLPCSRAGGGCWAKSLAAALGALMLEFHS